MSENDFVYFALAESYNPVAVYPLNKITRGRDMSGRKNLPGTLRGVRPAPGPDGKRGTSFRFFGRPNSYIELPNKKFGPLDTVNSITIGVWIYPVQPGPIVNYDPSGWGLHLWVVGKTTLYARFSRRSGKGAPPALVSRRLRHRKWQYVVISYSRRTQLAKLYINNVMRRWRRIGKIRLRTQYPVRLGARKGDRRYFKGRISCVQIYNTALSARQISAKKRMCYRTRGKEEEKKDISNIFKPMILIKVCGLVFTTSVPTSARKGVPFVKLNAPHRHGGRGTGRGLRVSQSCNGGPSVP